jgi:hypothetical protein
MAFDGLWTINCVTVSFANYVLFRFFPISNFSYLAVKRAGRHSHRLGGLFYGQFILLPGLMYLKKLSGKGSGGLPNATPLAFAAAIPSAWCCLMLVRSFSATKESSIF